MGVVLVGLALGGCGDDAGGQDWAGYAAYLTNEVRDTPITEDELRDTFDDGFECDATENGFFLAQSVDNGSDPLGAAAALYYLCGEDQAVEVTRDVLGADAALEVRDEVERWALYDGGTD